jgi:hypothetical protein
VRADNTAAAPPLFERAEWAATRGDNNQKNGKGKPAINPRKTKSVLFFVFRTQKYGFPVLLKRKPERKTRTKNTAVWYRELAKPS